MDGELGHARTVGRQIWVRGQEDDRREPDRLKRHRQLDPDSADLVWVLVLAARPARVLEIGTGSGVSTIHLADAARRVGARVTTVDRVAHPDVVANLARAGVGDVVDRVVQDAGAFLRGAAREGVDLLFLDAERSEYVGYLPDLLDVLAPGATLVVDNLLRPAPDELTAFVEAVRQHPAMSGVPVDIGHGLYLAVKGVPASGPAQTGP